MALFLPEALVSAFLGLMEVSLLNAVHSHILVQAWRAGGAVKGLQPPYLLMPLDGVILKGPSCALSEPPFASGGRGMVPGPCRPDYGPKTMHRAGSDLS